MRAHVEPECLHSTWNDCRNALRRSDLQPALLLGTVLSNVAHGPFGSAAVQWSRGEAAEALAQDLTASEFQALKEAMAQDRYGEDTCDLPTDATDIPNLRSVTRLSMFVRCSGRHAKQLMHEQRSPDLRLLRLIPV